MTNPATIVAPPAPISSSKLCKELNSTCVNASAVCNELQAPAAIAVDQTQRFPLLTGEYEAHTFDYNVSDGPVTARDWLEVFRKSIPTYAKAAAADPSVPAGAARAAAAERFASMFNGVLDALGRDLTVSAVDGFTTQPLNCSTLCRVRDQALARCGFGDIFKPLKDAENGAALALLPSVLADLDAAGAGAGPDAADAASAAAASARLELALRGVLAGNVFDMGAAATAERAEAGGTAGGFAATRAALLPRPWAIDDLDALLAHFAARRAPHRKAVLFVDNAGADVVLGMLPLARELLKRGTRVVLAANAAPSINDVTAAELAALVSRAAALDALLARAVSEQALRVVSSGNDLGVIDLGRVSAALAAEAADADLVVIEGMGRGIETNLRARFACDALKIGMVKHPEVAALLNGRMYDGVVKFDPAP